MLTLSQYYFLWPFTVALTIWLKNLNASFCFSSSLSCLSLSLILCLHLSPTSAVIFWSSSFSFFLSLCLFLLCHFSSFLYLSGLFLLTFSHSHSLSLFHSFFLHSMKISDPLFSPRDIWDRFRVWQEQWESSYSQLQFSFPKEGM